MERARTVSDLRKQVGAWKKAGHRVGLVPTMGGLHTGHASLVAAAKDACDKVVATIFVNPTQFAPNEDFDRYPRTESADLELLAGAGADIVFMPPVEEVYPPGFGTSVTSDHLTDILCGAARPSHFHGVTLVVLKLLNMAGPDAAYFGEKDWQQLQVIRHMVRDLDVPVEICGVATAREHDGLAISTRNRYLSERARAAAPALFAVLTDAAVAIASGAPTELACAEAQETLFMKGFGKVEYLECRDGTTLRLAPSPAHGARIFGAAWLEETRLIDNVAVPGHHIGET